mmetsp:Transcript_9383/g.21750  ORF Transcript_9383/g.21750 Transcript_9383/m.21750 type:complete len:140 (-) Transcript_9383:2119-2538(-)
MLRLTPLGGTQGLNSGKKAMLCTRPGSTLTWLSVPTIRGDMVTCKCGGVFEGKRWVGKAMLGGSGAEDTAACQRCGGTKTGVDVPLFWRLGVRDQRLGVRTPVATISYAEWKSRAISPVTLAVQGASGSDVFHCMGGTS